jgi:hypothetical protein
MKMDAYFTRMYEKNTNDSFKKEFKIPYPEVFIDGKLNKTHY